jgi:type IV secretory pathway VirJ component
MMKRPYEKQPPPAWQKKLVLLVGFLFGATVLLYAAWAVILLVAPGMTE